MPTQTVTLYSPCLTLSAGCTLYTASTMSIGTEAPNGYYSDGNGNCYRVLSGGGTPLGTIVNVSVCSTPVAYNFKVYNTSTTATITEIRIASGFQFYSQDEGNPMPPGITPSGYLFGYGNTSQAVGVRIINGVVPICQRLYKNGTLLQSITLMGNNIHYFSAFPFSGTDEMKIVIEDGSC
jgi:hypothetical protein